MDMRGHITQAGLSTWDHMAVVTDHTNSTILWGVATKDQVDTVDLQDLVAQVDLQDLEEVVEVAVPLMDPVEVAHLDQVAMAVVDQVDQDLLVDCRGLHLLAP